MSLEKNMKNSTIKSELEKRNQKIIEAIIEKAKRDCPESLALIGIYGSFMTGDIHEKSDLDLLILINDDNGWQLGSTFIQDDLQVGHDLYCTTWESLTYDAKYSHPYISKLMDAKIVYCSEEKYRTKLEDLRKEASDCLQAPFSKEDFEKAEAFLKEAEHFYTNAMISETMAEARSQAAEVIYCVENAIAMLNKKYFRFGVKRVYEELKKMEKRPENLCERIQEVVSQKEADGIKHQLTLLMQETIAVFEESRTQFIPEKKIPSEDELRGTYEEMFSNWRNKMYYAATVGDKHLAFMSMGSLNGMLNDISEATKIGSYDVFDGFLPENLEQTAKNFDSVLEKYRKEYEKIGLSVKHYADVEEFEKDYGQKLC